MQHNVYTPGAGNQPPVLAGRDALLQQWSISLNDVVTQGRSRSLDTIITGPRGVGKTALMQAFAKLATAQGFEVVNLQAVTGRGGLMPELLSWANTRINDEAGPWLRAKQALATIGGISLTVGGLGVGISRTNAAEPEHFSPTVIAKALQSLSAEIQKDSPLGGLLLTIDEIQAAAPTDIALIAAILHRLNVEYPQARILFLATGLPQTIDQLYKAGVTHPDRLFVLDTIPPTLTRQEAEYAIIEPANRVGVTWEPAAVKQIWESTNGHPAHLQLFAYETWKSANGPSITEYDAQKGTAIAQRQLETQTLEPQWRRFSDREREFLVALAAIGGTSTTSRIARTLDRKTSQTSKTRDSLLKKGTVFSPRFGELTIAVPAMINYVLQHYEQSREEATVKLLPLATILSTQAEESTSNTIH